METVMAENREMRILMDQIGNELQNIIGSVYTQDNASTMRSPTVPESLVYIPKALQPGDVNPNPVSDSTDQSFDRTIGNNNVSETQLLVPANAAMALTAKLTSRASYASTYPSKRPFSIVLNSSWVYRRVKAYSLDLSLNSSKLQGRAWSMFSGVSLNDVSVISFIRLPLRLSDIPHDAWYCRIPREISPDSLNFGANDPFIIAVVSESMSGKSSLVDRVCTFVEKECHNMLVLISYTDLWR
jgi:hypothetical protein